MAVLIAGLRAITRIEVAVAWQQVPLGRLFSNDAFHRLLLSPTIPVDECQPTSRRKVLEHAVVWHVLTLNSASLVVAASTNVCPANAAVADRRQSTEDSFTSTGSTSSSSSPPSKLALRLEESILQQPTPTMVPAELNGVDNFFYPSFMAGTWNVTQTLVNVTTPLGLIYLGGPNGDISIAEKTLAESRSRLNVPVQLQLRYVNTTKWGVAEDRLFNTRNRLNAFAGRSVVAATDYADVASCNRAKILAMGGSYDDPLQTTFVRFKGPAAQKIFVTTHSADDVTTTTTNSNKWTWTGSESQRSIFALTNENTAPPIFTDTETIWQFTIENNQPRSNEPPPPSPPQVVQGRLRIASYLNAQQDKLYFQARSKAVSLLDYKLEMVRAS
ncbi:hypothetical protein ACA910_018138 [Epithemia clementina (nom. ined.)]